MEKINYSNDSVVYVVDKTVKDFVNQEGLDYSAEGYEHGGRKKGKYYINNSRILVLALPSKFMSNCITKSLN